jgi:pyruvate dehydrogenase E2 component (dihydrolipoamide acetyltransferase)
MPTEVIMPQMGESIFEGTITKWLKKAGDAVEKDEPLFEISTDKVDAEIPSPVAGVLSEIKFPEGATVQVNTVVAVLADKDGSSAKTGSVGVQQAPAHAAKVAAPEVAPKAQSAAPQVATGAVGVVMPQMGESIFEGTITKWLKKVGDAVKKDEPLFEISTDKVDAEIPSPVDGVLSEIRAAEGETVRVNTVVAVVGGASGAGGRAFGAKTEMASAGPTAAKPVTVLNGEPVVVAQAQLALPQVVRSSPLVRKIAKEHNVDLAQVRGTGSNGRVTKDDILGFIAGRSAGMAPAQVPAKPRLTPALVALADEVVPLTKMRAIIAQRMVESKRTIPHAHVVYKVDMTRIARLRERERESFEKRHGFRLTYMPFIAAAVVDALRKFPILNASLVENSIHYHAHINLGVAVALEWGLIVPVVRESERQNFVGLAQAINDLAGRARAKKLMPDEVGGSTFTLTNAGAFGGEYGMPVINPGESAILAIGGLRKEPVVLTDAEGNDTIAIRSVQYFCLGLDHRLIDGADSGKFMTEFKNVLEKWDQEIG